MKNLRAYGFGCRVQGLVTILENQMEETMEIEWRLLLRVQGVGLGRDQNQMDKRTGNRNWFMCFPRVFKELKLSKQGRQNPCYEVRG